MKLEILEELKTIRTGETACPNRYTTLIKEIGQRGSFDENFLIETSIKFGMTQVVTRERVSHSVTDPFITEHNQAVRAMAHTIYGPVVESLYPILFQCYERGETETADCLSKVINELKGKW